MDAPEKIVIRDAEGNVTEEAAMQNGVLNGETVLYTAGRVRARLQFREGKQQGEAVFFDPAGQVQTKAQYLDGKLHGESLHFSPTGQLMRKATYAAGLLHGFAIDYHPSGKPREISSYKEDVLDGELARITEDGKVVERLYYENGRLRPKPHAGPKTAAAKAGAPRA